GKTFQLTSSPNTMEINGTNGFNQVNSATSAVVRIINGSISGLRTSAGVWSLGSTLTGGGGGTPQGILELRDNGNLRVRLRAREANLGSELELFDQSGALDIALIADNALSGLACGLYVRGQRVVGPRFPAITPPAGGGTVDTQARTAIGDILNTLN